MLRLPTRHVLPALPPREARQLQLWLPRHGRRWCATPLLLPPREPPTFAGARSSLTTDPAAASPRNQGTRTCRVGRKATLRRSHLGANPGMEAASGVRLFTVVRHPVQRFVSAASQLKSLGLLAANASCADTLRTVELRGPFDAHLRPQTAFMVDGRGEPLRFEWIFTVEELANVTRLLGMEPAVEDALRVHSLPRGNGFHCRAAERRRIEQLYEVDYRAFRLAGVRFRWAS
mmetsp:Transcript_33026/g.109101  ORF Transcript_33026/g.109101 Transcript_33026/m.109101 type:complete len:232 (-) Transcript_33026:113-808(-)